jgi:hypothetical protein
MRSGWNWRLSGKRRKRAVLMLEPQGRSHPMRPNEQDPSGGEAMTHPITFDLDDDFDGIDMELAIVEARKAGATDAARILSIIQHKWVVQIGHPEWSKLGDRERGGEAMIDVEALAKAAGLLWAGRDVWDGPEAGVSPSQHALKAFAALVLEEAALVAESIGTDASQRKVAAAKIRALKPS